METHGAGIGHHSGDNEEIEAVGADDTLQETTTGKQKASEARTPDIPAQLVIHDILLERLHGIDHKVVELRLLLGSVEDLSTDKQGAEVVLAIINVIDDVGLYEVVLLVRRGLGLGFFGLLLG